MLPKRTHPLERLNKVEGGNFICKSEKSLNNDHYCFQTYRFMVNTKVGLLMPHELLLSASLA